MFTLVILDLIGNLYANGIFGAGFGRTNFMDVKAI